MRLGDCGKTNLHTYSDKEKWSLIRYLDTGSITEGRIDEIQTLYPGVDKIPSRARRKASVGDILSLLFVQIRSIMELLKQEPRIFSYPQDSPL